MLQFINQRGRRTVGKKKLICDPNSLYFLNLFPLEQSIWKQYPGMSLIKYKVTQGNLLGPVMSVKSYFFP